MKIFINFSLAVLVAAFMVVTACSFIDDNGDSQKEEPSVEVDVSAQNLERAMVLFETAYNNYFEQSSGLKMHRYYNPYTKTVSSEIGSVWMYTSAIEAANAIISAMISLKDDGDTSIYDGKYAKYTGILERLVAGLDYYQGTYSLISFTQTKMWSVYAVNRAGTAGGADVTGKNNVYDDQMWLIRELVEAYRLTGTKSYLTKAEYLAEYVLDGWDCTIVKGAERGGIPWGPGYYSKHSCSNGPVISPLVWLSEIYSGSDDEITYRYIDKTDGKTRKTLQMKKSEYYLMFAKKIYSWQRANLLYTSGEEKGLFADNLNSPVIGGTIQSETVDGVVYRKPTSLNSFNGPAYTYNVGAMTSGAGDLYRVTGESSYLYELKGYVDKAFKYFATASAVSEGCYNYPLTGFNIWFNGVMMRSWAEAVEHYDGAEAPLESFQKNLDYGWTNSLYEGMLPPGLLGGWNTDRSKDSEEGMFAFTYAAEFAVLSRHYTNQH